MTQEDKQLLFKDICARLPYGVKINIYDDYSGTMKDEELNAFHINSIYNIEYRKLRPYLRSMSSMSKEEAIEMLSTIINTDGIIGYKLEKDKFKFIFKSGTGHFGGFTIIFFNTIYCLKQFDWLNTHHFDYRGLIEKGLAIEAPEGMYKN